MPTLQDPRFHPFIKSGWEADIDPHAPRLTLELKAHMPSGGAELCMTTPYNILFAFTRAPDDGNNMPITCGWTHWDGMMLGQFVLLHETAWGVLEQVHAGIMNGPVNEPFLRKNENEVSLHSSGTWQIVPGGRSAPLGHLTANYQTKLIPGQRYHFFWPGGEIKMWEWGDIDGLFEKVGPTLRRGALNGPLPSLMLPPSGVISFIAMEAPEPWPEREELIEHDAPHSSYDWANFLEEDWRREQERLRNPPAVRIPDLILPDERIAGSPILNLEIVRAGQGRSSMAKARSTVTLSIKVTYQAESEDGPITIRTWRFNAGHYEVYHWHGTGWQYSDDSDIIACPHFDFDEDPDDEDTSDVEIKIGDDKHAISLQPGESWTREQTFLVPVTTQVGDKFKAVFKGTSIDWWAPGDLQDHAETVVTLPRWGEGKFGDVIPSEEDEKRPKLVVPGATLDFVWEDQ